MTGGEQGCPRLVYWQAKSLHPPLLVRFEDDEVGGVRLCCYGLAGARRNKSEEVVFLPQENEPWRAKVSAAVWSSKANSQAGSTIGRCLWVG